MSGKGAAKAPDDLIELGKIVAAYGIKGWIKVQPHSVTSDVLRKAHTWWLLAPVSPAQKNIRSSALAHTFIERRIVTARPQGSTIVAQLAELDDRDDAQALAGFTVHVSRLLFPPAKKDEFYWIDLVGCFVYSSDLANSEVNLASKPNKNTEGFVGVVIEVLDNGAHAILRVQRRSPTQTDQAMLDSKGKEVEMLIPFVAAHVQHVDAAARKIVTDWPLDF